MAELFTLPVSVRQAIKALTDGLSQIYHRDEAKAIAWQALEHVLQASRVQLLTRQEAPIAAPQAARLTQIAKRLLQHEPIQYITGQTEFCGLTLQVGPGVLIPRPETEELAYYIIAENRNRMNLKVLDIGTGSGCLALALKAGLAGAEVHAIDISEEALQIAKSNAQQTNLKVTFHKADILNHSPLSLPSGFDIIVSNPPYVLQTEEEEMLPNVLNFEPHGALFVPDTDPLLFYNAITNFAEKALNQNGNLYFETNRKYTKTIGQHLKRRGFTKVKVLDDLFGNPRFVAAAKRI